MLKTAPDAQSSKNGQEIEDGWIPQLKKQKQDSKAGDGDANVIPAKDTWSLGSQQFAGKLKKLDKYNKDDKDDK